MRKIYKDPHLTATLDVDNKVVYFWRGQFSQWWRSPIYDDKHKVNFNTAEQGMMYYKAILFDDKETAAKILEAKSPRDQKDLGRLVKGYNEEKWLNNRINIVTYINYMKFSQDDTLHSLIVSLKDWEFVEASPMDKIWGIGLAEDNEDIFDVTKWQGLNLLGQCIKNAQRLIIKQL
ncbi:MAG: NADAR family protein [bacterium]